MKKRLQAQKKKFCRSNWQMYEALMNELMDYLAPVQTNGNILAILDCITCFANNAIQYQL